MPDAPFPGIFESPGVILTPPEVPKNTKRRHRESKVEKDDSNLTFLEEPPPVENQDCLMQIGCTEQSTKGHHVRRKLDLEMVVGLKENKEEEGEIIESLAPEVICTCEDKNTDQISESEQRTLDALMMSANHGKSLHNS